MTSDKRNAGLAWVTSFAVRDGQVGPHIEQAIKATARLESISCIVVVTETPLEQVVACFPEISHDKIEIVQVKARPSFGDLFAQVNRLLRRRKVSQRPRAIAVANADIAFESDDDVRRILTGMQQLATEPDPCVLSLTRHDQHSGRRDVSLRNAVGLPNVMSADVWVFDRAIRQVESYDYCPGQMFCDQYLSHDLLCAGYAVFNPCLDCVAVHWETETKSQEYYRAASQNKDNREAVLKHWREKVAPGLGQYCGIVHTSMAALTSGYRPQPIKMSERRKKLYLFVSNYHRDHSRVQEILRGLEADSVDVYVVFDSAEEASSWERFVVEQGLGWLYCLLAFSNAQVVKQFLAGLDKHHTNLLLTPYPVGVQQQLMDAYDAILIWFQSVEYRVDESRLKTYFVHDLPESSSTLFVDALSDGFQIGVSWGTDFKSLKQKHNVLMEVAPS